jgi:FKBP-type peptidyl-prolyl cis-trans isomerase
MKTFSLAGIFRLLTLLLVVATAGLTTSCLKTEVPADYSAVDDATIQKYLTTNAITTAQKQASGLYFIPVVTNPTGKKVVVGQQALAMITGTLLDGTVFTSPAMTNNRPLDLIVGAGQYLIGLEEGISLMRVGEKATLLLPSGLAYRSNGLSPSVPANTVVRFDVEVVPYSAVDDAIIQKYLADNNITNAQKQESGLYYVPVTTNPGAVQAAKNNTVSVLYTGKLTDGKVFDASSLHNNAPYSFVLGAGNVIRGWDEGIALMHKGDKGKLLIPPALGYGAKIVSASIPANAVLIFDVELTDVK